MSNERDTGVPLTRRRLLASVGAVGATSLAGCVDPFGEDEPDITSNLEQVQLAQIPAQYASEDARVVVPSPDIITELGLRNQQQIRVERPGEVFDGDFLSALYTTQNSVEFKREKKRTIWMSESGLERINAGKGWYVALKTIVPHEEWDSDGEAKENNEYAEQIVDAGGDDLLIAAPYGGDIYAGTDLQALRIASEMSENAWVCHGYNNGGGAYDRWYVNPTRIHPRSYPQLGELVGYDGDTKEDEKHIYDIDYDYAVLLTGTEDRGVYVGGLVEDEVKKKVRDGIAQSLADAGASSIPVSISRTGPPAAIDTKNLANRLSDDKHQGIQIQQGREVREDYWQAMADGLIEVFSEL